MDDRGFLAANIFNFYSHPNIINFYDILKIHEPRAASILGQF